MLRHPPKSKITRIWRNLSGFTLINAFITILLAVRPILRNFRHFFVFLYTYIKLSSPRVARNNRIHTPLWARDFLFPNFYFILGTNYFFRCKIILMATSYASRGYSLSKKNEFYLIIKHETVYFIIDADFHLK